jgi:6-phosphofructokinase 2
LPQIAQILIKFIESFRLINLPKMKNFDIVTLTVNPALDKSTHFRGLVPEQKIRCETPRFDAGGGGINVSKAIAHLGGSSKALFTSGGFTGEMLKEIVKKEGISFETIEIHSDTRESFVAVDDNTNLQYRFGFKGAEINETEKNKIIQLIQELKSDYLIVSGSLNEGLPVDFYKKIAEITKKLEIKLIIDSDGEALVKALEVGVFMIKPNVSELSKLIGVKSLEMEEINHAAKQIIANGGAEIVVVSLGSQGAVLVTKDYYEFVSAPNVVKKSTVGAGDSMVGGMVLALSQNKSLKEVLRWGVACGSAATMNEGTQLFKMEDAKRLFEWLKDK